MPGHETASSAPGSTRTSSAEVERGEQGGQRVDAVGARLATCSRRLSLAGRGLDPHAACPLGRSPSSASAPSAPPSGRSRRGQALGARVGRVAELLEGGPGRLAQARGRARSQGQRAAERLAAVREGGVDERHHGARRPRRRSGAMPRAPSPPSARGGTRCAAPGARPSPCRRAGPAPMSRRRSCPPARPRGARPPRAGPSTARGTRQASARPIAAGPSPRRRRAGWPPSCRAGDRATRGRASRRRPGAGWCWRRARGRRAAEPPGTRRPPPRARGALARRGTPRARRGPRPPRAPRRRPKLGRSADHVEQVVVDQEVLSQLGIGAHPEALEPVEARLARQLGGAVAHQRKTRAALRSTTVPIVSTSVPRTSARSEAVWITLAGSFGLPRSGTGAR